MKKNSLLLLFLFFFYQCQNDNSEQQTTEEQVFEAEQMPYETALQAIFPAEIIQQIRIYQNDLQQIKTAQDAANFYQSATVLRDTLTPILSDYSEQFVDTTLPDFFWLKEVLPTFVPQLVAEGTAYYLFHDYRQWAAITRPTSDLTDDAFVELQYQLHPDDSIEYFYPAYFFQTWDYGGSSLLGRGIHVSLLNSMEGTWADSTQQLFKKEIMADKTRLLNDILESTEGGYWETQTNILNELGEIISTDYAILTKNEKIAVRQRQQQFREPQKNNILVDVQSGN